MTTTFAGETLPTLNAIARHYHPPLVQRTQHTPIPTIWCALINNWLRLREKYAAWNSWQALASCEYSEVRSFRHRLAVLQQFPARLTEASTYGLTPDVLVKVIERCLTDRRLTVHEASRLEEAILARLDAHGRWMNVQ